MITGKYKCGTTPVYR